jgi:hypothetical protein
VVILAKISTIVARNFDINNTPGKFNFLPVGHSPKSARNSIPGATMVSGKSGSRGLFSIRLDSAPASEEIHAIF